MLGRIFGPPVMMRSTPSISDSLGHRTTNCSQSHGVRNELSLPPTWTIRALLRSSKPDRPGVILFRGGAYSDREMLALLDRVLARASTLDLEHSIVVVDRKRIRRRALPISK